jgi:5-methylcytosine-specific restriction endonuclease McrA
VKRSPLRRVAVKKAAKARDWWQVRAWCLDRAQGCCEVCGGKAHHAHHILPRSAGGQDELGNLLSCCHTCHRRIHDNPQWAYERGYLRSRYGRRVA